MEDKKKTSGSPSGTGISVKVEIDGEPYDGQH